MPAGEQTPGDPDSGSGHLPCRDIASLSEQVEEGVFLHALAHLGAGRVRSLCSVLVCQATVVTATILDAVPAGVRLTSSTASCTSDGDVSAALCVHAVATALADVVRLTELSLTDLTAQWFSLGSRTEPAVPGQRDLAAHESVSWDDLDWSDPILGDEQSDEDGLTLPEQGLTLGERGPVAQIAVHRFLTGLTPPQLRSLLLALANDVPDVAEVLLELAEPQE